MAGFMVSLLEKVSSCPIDPLGQLLLEVLLLSRVSIILPMHHLFCHSLL